MVSVGHALPKPPLPPPVPVRDEENTITNNKQQKKCLERNRFLDDLHISNALRTFDVRRGPHAIRSTRAVAGVGWWMMETVLDRRLTRSDCLD